MRFSDFRKVRFKGWTEKTRVCHIFSQSYAYWKAYIKFMAQGIECCCRFKAKQDLDFQETNKSSPFLSTHPSSLC